MRTYGAVLAMFIVHNDFVRYWLSGSRKVYCYDGWAARTGEVVLRQHCQGCCWHTAIAQTGTKQSST